MLLHAANTAGARDGVASIDVALSCQWRQLDIKRSLGMDKGHRL